MSQDVLVAGLIFIVAYVLIAAEPFDRTIIALVAGLLTIVVGIIDQEQAFRAIDLNVIFLLAGMMVIASALGRTGFFDWLAVRSVRMSGGRPLRLLLILSIVTAVSSAFLDNVTTVILMGPIVLVVSRRLGVTPVPYLIAVILASNIGGTATLIGDPPNILIGSASGLDFMDFLVNLAPLTLIVFAVYLVIVVFFFRNHLEVPEERRNEAVAATEEKTIHDRGQLATVLLIVAATIVGFLFSSLLNVEVATVALLGATAVMIFVRLDPHTAFRDVEWSTLFFFVGLFILVEAIVAVGIVSGIAHALADASGGDVATASISLLWFSAISSGIVDNIPYTATAIPVVRELIGAGLDPDPLWWSLALGACLGGNLTIVGASANVVVANQALRAGHKIGFFTFMRYGALIVLVSMLISTVYVWVRYLA